MPPSSGGSNYTGRPPLTPPADQTWPGGAGSVRVQRRAPSAHGAPTPLPHLFGLSTRVTKHRFASDVPKLQRHLATTLSQAFSESYNASNASVYNRMIEFTTDLQRRGHNFSLIHSSLLWMQMLLDNGEVSAQGAYQYTINLAAALRQFHGIDIPSEDDQHLWSMFRRALLRQGAKVPSRQAPPMKHETMRRIVNDRGRSTQERVSVAIAWLTAARGADLRNLTMSRIRLVGNDEMMLDFTGTKTDPFREGLHSTIRLPPDLAPMIVEYLYQFRSQPEAHPFPLTGAQLTALVRDYDPTLSGHSIRRGSLQHLLLKGAELDAIRRFGRYRTLEGLLHYLPLAELPLQRQIAETSVLLF